VGRLTSARSRRRTARAHANEYEDGLEYRTQLSGMLVISPVCIL